MGASSIHIERGQKMADVVLSELHPRLTVLKHKTRRTSGQWQYVLFAAVEDRVEEKVFGLVVLMHRNPSPHVWWNFTYKFVDETMGPFEDECPAEVFDLLTPTDDENANDWRGRVRLHLEQPKPAPVKTGTVIEFPSPLRFSDGREYSRFTFVRRTTFRREDQVLVRIPSWRARGGKVVAA